MVSTTAIVIGVIVGFVCIFITVREIVKYWNR